MYKYQHHGNKQSGDYDWYQYHKYRYQYQLEYYYSTIIQMYTFVTPLSHVCIRYHTSNTISTKSTFESCKTFRGVGYGLWHVLGVIIIATNTTNTRISTKSTFVSCKACQRVDYGQWQVSRVACWSKNGQGLSPEF